jgi:hypothetical protein
MFASLYLCNILSAYSQLPSGSGSVYNPGATAKVLDLFLLFRSDIKIGRGASSCPIPIGTPTYRRRASSVSSSSSGSWSAAVVRVTPPDPGICNFKLWQAPETRILAHVSVTGWLADQLLPIAANCSQLLLLLAIYHRPIQARLPSTPRDAGPAPRNFLPELLRPVALPLLTSSVS